jgi:hypothetical protein
MNSLSFQISPSPDSNDHQIRPIIDGTDWLGEEYLGLDPPMFFQEKALYQNGELSVGRCTCGCLGCGDYWVITSFTDTQVRWKIFPETELIFEKQNYLETVKIYSEDFSWEDLNRRVERLVSKIFAHQTIQNKYLFDWASARIEPNTVKLSFSNSKEGQKLFQFYWNGKSENDALKNAQAL